MTAVAQKLAEIKRLIAARSATTDHSNEGNEAVNIITDREITPGLPLVRNAHAIDPHA